jgi:dolichol-phosphate mannosyltransferase
LSKNLVVIPTYNEKENVAGIIAAVFDNGPDYHVLIVDDGSPDGTADIVRKLQKDHSGRLHMVERSGKLGLGTAYIHGFKWGLERDYDLFFEMDADFSHDPKDLPRLADACNNQNGDVAVGSRYMKGGKLVNWGWYRILLSYGASRYVRIITGMRVKDPTAGFICYRRKVLQTLNLDGIQFVGYAFQIEMKYKSHINGFNIVEIPITFKDREAGTSKMNTSIIKEAIIGVIKLRRAAKPEK